MPPQGLYPIPAARRAAPDPADPEPRPEQRSGDREQVERLLNELRERESDVVRMYFLEGKSYREIGRAAGVSRNSVGPILSRARRKMRQVMLKTAAR